MYRLKKQQSGTKQMVEININTGLLIIPMSTPTSCFNLLPLRMDVQVIVIEIYPWWNGTSILDPHMY